MFTLADCPAGVREDLARFATLVRRWNPAVNLIGRATLDDLEVRHIADSLQLRGIAGIAAGHWVDLGTGGGFPGMVIAIAAAHLTPALRVTCIEADQRKAAFLGTVARDLGLQVQILPARIESAHPQNADVISARALAPLDRLLLLAAPHLAPGGIAIFPKGARHATEVAAARQHWRFELAEIPSQTDPEAIILRIEDLRHA